MEDAGAEEGDDDDDDGGDDDDDDDDGDVDPDDDDDDESSANSEGDAAFRTCSWQPPWSLQQREHILGSLPHFLLKLFVHLHFPLSNFC